MTMMLLLLLLLWWWVWSDQRRWRRRWKRVSAWRARTRNKSPQTHNSLVIAFQISAPQIKPVPPLIRRQSVRLFIPLIPLLSVLLLPVTKYTRPIQQGLPFKSTHITSPNATHFLISCHASKRRWFYTLYIRENWMSFTSANKDLSPDPLSVSPSHETQSQAPFDFCYLHSESKTNPARLLFCDP